jgi:hypothetical protein
MHAHRYLGEISDISFFNSVKGLLQSDSSVSHRQTVPLESYERETAELANPIDTSRLESS